MQRRGVAGEVSLPCLSRASHDSRRPKPVPGKLLEFVNKRSSQPTVETDSHTGLIAQAETHHTRSEVTHNTPPRADARALIAGQGRPALY